MQSSNSNIDGDEISQNYGKEVIFSKYFTRRLTFNFRPVDGYFC